MINLEIIKKFLNKFVLLRFTYVLLVTAKSEGIRRGFKALFKFIEKERMEKVGRSDIEQLQSITNRFLGVTSIVYCPLIDWNVPLYQRPQHMAINLAREGFLYFYCTSNFTYDKVVGFNQIADNLYLTNRFRLLLNLPGHRIIHLCSTDNVTEYEVIASEIDKGNLVVYEYIDEIHDRISGIAIPENTYRRHEMLLKDERCIVVATADKLYQDVLGHRSKNCILVTNGVDFRHFSRQFSDEEMPEELRPIVRRGRPIIGYFGALACWFDYELVCKLAAARPDCELLLIGWDYDHSIKDFDLFRYENIHVIGPINYQDLPRYAFWFDLATIPFLINEITESTSPIKLFEYMALGKPIVTTDMPECRKYRSVLIGNNHDDFIDKIESALALRTDPQYAAILKREALENTWEAKASAIAAIIRKNLQGNG